MVSKNNLKQNFSKMLVKKIFSENHYQKYYVRKNILDNNTSLYNYKKNSSSGSSVFSAIYVYSHVHNNKFTFKSFLNKKNLYSKDYLQNFYNTLISFKNKKNNLYLLNPIRGGFLSYFSGHTGFIPASNVFFFVQKFLVKPESKMFFMLNFVSTSFFKIKKILRFLLTGIKLKPILYARKKNFSKAKKKGGGVSSLRFKSVFLVRKT